MRKLISLATILWALALPAAALPAPMVTKEDKAKFDVWARIRKPTTGPAEPVGSYDAGCLNGAVKIDPNGRGYAIMRPSRRRNYGHPLMDQYLHALGEKLADEKAPLLLIGDVGPARGGPMLSGHASHQIGLDADLWLTALRKRPTGRDRERLSAPSFVSGRKKLKAKWSETQTKIVAAAADFAQVSRVFVSPPIKKYFCEHQPTAAWLYKLRPWWGHEEHIHVRLGCPAGSTACVAQNALNPSESGCGKDLDWWFSKEADDEWDKMRKDPSPRKFPELPSACLALPSA